MAVLSPALLLAGLSPSLANCPNPVLHRERVDIVGGLTLSQYSNMEHRVHFLRPLPVFPHPWHFRMPLDRLQNSLTLSLRAIRPSSDTGNICNETLSSVGGGD